MWAKKTAGWIVVVALAGICPARAWDPETGPAVATGVELDLLPMALSAAGGKPGGSLQLWAGQGQWRLRAVGALIRFPDGLTARPFRDQDLAVAALIVDHFFEEGFRGPWVGAGAEAWRSSIRLFGGGERAAWTDWVATAGGGWVFPVWRGLTVNPWGAVHARLGGGPVRVGGETYRPRRFQAEVSLKLGWTF